MTEFADNNQFATTRWSVVLQAGTNGEEGRRALGTLCEMYWQPLYYFLRRKGHAPEEAIDLVQGFLVSLLEKGHLRPLDRAKGRFRSYLMAGLSHFLSNERMRERRIKRGGATMTVSLDSLVAEQWYRELEHEDRTPEALYEKQWALRLLDHVMCDLERQYSLNGQAAVFAALKGAITDEMTESYAEAGQRLGMSEATVRVAAHRLRKRYREIFRSTILDTVEDETALADEVNFLLEALK